MRKKEISYNKGEGTLNTEGRNKKYVGKLHKKSSFIAAVIQVLPIPLFME